MFTYQEIQSADSEARLCIKGDWSDSHRQMAVSVYDGSFWNSPDVTLTLEQVIDLRERLDKWLATGSLKFDGEK